MVLEEKRLTAHAVTKLFGHILVENEENNYILGVFLDLSKAFDMTDHDMLVKTIYHWHYRRVLN